MSLIKNFFSSKGILGINARNLLYIKPYNPKKAIKLADDKIKTKQFLSARGIPVPKLFASIKDMIDLEKFDFNILPSSFALKPNTGYGGEGIIPIIDVKEGFYLTANKKNLTRNELKDHIQDILDGRFSISNVSDYAFFEQYIFTDERLAQFSYAGLPDIRIVVHNLIPVMAMLRLPTKESNGKANLHQGAIGVGIDIAKGQTTHISYRNKILEFLPDNLGSIKGFKIPYWEEILTIASKIQLITNLGYMAVDICIDKNSGPVLLEINARAGLGVQIANLAPLRKRLERIQGLKVGSPTKGVRIAKDMFGHTVEKEIEELSGKPVVGLEEQVEVIQKKGTLRIMAKIDTSQNISIIDEEIALKSGLLENSEDYDDEKSTLKIKFTLKNKRIHTVVEVEKIPRQEYKMIIGIRDLKEFLIDSSSQKISSISSKKLENKDKKNRMDSFEIFRSGKKINFNEIDQELLQIDNKIKLLYHLRPINLEVEREKFFKNPKTNPQFEYPQLKFDPVELQFKLSRIEIDNSVLGDIFSKKKLELEKKIKLLENIDEEEFTEISTELYGKPTMVDITKCGELISQYIAKNKIGEQDKAILNSETAKLRFEEAFKKYNLKWKVKIKENLVSNCIAGKNDSLFIRANASFTENRLQALITHEIETHILTAENGKMQPYGIFNRGLAGYLDTQEGLAVYNVEQQHHELFIENIKALSHVIAIHEAINKSFSEVYKILLAMGIPYEQAFRSSLKCKRGISDTSKPGAFTKDYIYFSGYFSVREFIKNGGNIKDLYIGKINLKDLQKIKKIPGIKAPHILPAWLQ